MAAPTQNTPVIDQLARDGVRFTQFYANGAECTPSRTALLTGRYPQRAGGLECAIGTGNVGRYDDAIRLAGANELGLPANQALLPGKLVDRGYNTGIFGKWHLGYETKFNPLEFGWNKFFGVLGGNCDYFTHKELSPLPVLFEDRTAVEREGYMTHLITDAAISFLETQKKASKTPFLLYVPYTTPHFPFQTPDDTETVYNEENFTSGTRKNYAAMLEDLDQQVGRLLEALAKNDQADNTLVAFASDHGAMKPGRNLPLNGFKGGLFEGGIRAPLMVRWPDKIKPGQVCHQSATMIDFTASILQIADVDTGDLKLDGIDILSHVRSGKADFERTHFWRARRGDRTWRAVRDGSMKYIHRVENGITDTWLFDLAKDPGEKENLVSMDRTRTEHLANLLGTWEKETPAER